MIKKARDMNPVYRYLQLSIVVLCLAHRLPAQDFSGEMEDLMDDNNLVGLAVGVRCGDTDLTTFYGGLADVSNSIEIDENTLFRVASISKSFTALGLMKLYDQGLFQLDDDISDALGYEVRNPSFPDTPISYRMLLSHQSSLQDGSGYGPFLAATYNASPIPAIHEVLLEDGDYYTSNMWRTEAPGSYFAYSNINYGLIGTLIEALSGERFDVFMEGEVLQPLGINGGYNVADLEEIENLAVLYRDNVPQADNYGGENPDPIITGIYAPGTNGAIFAPQGGLRCTLNDLLNFATMIYNSGSFNGTEIISEEALEEMMSMQWDYNGSNGDNYFGLFNRWGLGLHHAGADGVNDRVVNGEILVGHPGEAYGLISDLYVHPETGYTIAFITNGYNSGGGYDFGEESIYYLPEEVTFSLAEDYYWETCASLDLSELFPSGRCGEIQYNEVSSRVEFDESFSGGHLQVISMDGRMIQEGWLKESDVELDLSSGLNIIRISDETSTCIRKFFIYP
jgi:CubicO group peptidase (beta-lactamase class C family)